MVIITRTSKLFLLSIFLLTPVATHCMEKKDSEIIVPNSMKALFNQRHELKKEIISIEFYKTGGYMPILERPLAVRSFFQSHHPIISTDLLSRKLFLYKRSNFQGYSLLGPVTMAIKSLHTPEDVSFQDKKQCIKNLLEYSFQPTAQDKELAIVEQWERWLPLIKRITLFRCADFLQEIPKDVIRYIEQSIISTEPPLF